MRALITIIFALVLLGCTNTPEKEGVITAQWGFPQSARFLVKFPVIYPDEAATKGITGTVSAEFSINEKGIADQVSILETSNELFTEAAKQAFAKTRFRPSENEEERAKRYRAEFRFEKEHIERGRHLMEFNVIN